MPGSEAAWATRLVAPALALAAVAAAWPRTAAPEAVVLRASDGVAVHGLRRPAAGRPRAILLLFHQAGGSKGEYAVIAPRLAREGYETLAIDQRAGGDAYGRNATVAALGASRPYAEARRDLEAALAWTRGRELPVVLWGSSYSAALVFQVAAANPGRVAAVVAFSPGEYLDDPGAVRRAAATVTAPVYVTSAADPGEVGAARAILTATRSRAPLAFAPRAGVHGSSTLVATRNPGGAEVAWASVLAFLSRHSGGT